VRPHSGEVAHAADSFWTVTLLR